MPDHTPEPWRPGNLGLRSYDAYTGRPFRNIWAGVPPDSVVVARCIDRGDDRSEADARRIVACVNALADIPTAVVESPGFADALFRFRGHLF